MATTEPLLNPTGIAQLREALTTADYTTAGIAGRIGEVAVLGVRRNDFRALLRATTDRDRLATLVRLFIAGQTEPEQAVAEALTPLPLADALAAGLIERYGDGLHAGVDLDVYAPAPGTVGHSTPDWWVLSDLDADARPGPLRTDHVLGIGNAATTLAGATVRGPVGTALDVGTGCGVQSLHLSTHAERVAATDLSERALRFAATTAALNGLNWELLAGDLLAPVAGRRFDLVVSNPPFVIGPAGPVHYTYRDSGRGGDAICAELAGSAGDLLNPGGTMQFLANWIHIAGEDWRERVAGWVAGTGCDAWIVQREVSDPVEYVHLWLRDAAEGLDPQRAAAWLDWFDAQKVEAVGFGLVTLRANQNHHPLVLVEELRQAVEPPLGARVSAWFDRQEWLRSAGDRLLDARFRRADGLRLSQEATYGADDWEVGAQVLALTDGLGWAEEVDPLVLAVVSGADGTVPLRDQVAVLAAAFDTPPAMLGAMLDPVVRHLVGRGVLLPVP